MGPCNGWLLGRGKNSKCLEFGIDLFAVRLINLQLFVVVVFCLFVCLLFVCLLLVVIHIRPHKLDLPLNFQTALGREVNVQSAKVHFFQEFFCLGFPTNHLIKFKKLTTTNSQYIVCGA